MRDLPWGSAAVSARAQVLSVGIDVGSTTAKIAVLGEDGTLLHHEYVRHNADQARAVVRLLDRALERFDGAKLQVVVCGSGGARVADALGAPFVQEVVANGIVVRQRYPHVRTAVELGGQDAKIVFFKEDPATGKTVVADMRMNGACAGGTGAFIDQIAELLKVSPEEFGALAAKGKTVHDVSGRCGVFAKTDIQPLLNRGVPREDIALSTFHAIAKQTIGGLAQGVPLTPPIIFEGGPLVFNPTLVRVFQERLQLTDEQVIVPDHAEILVAVGAALSRKELFAGPDGHASSGMDLVRLRAYADDPSEGRTAVADAFFPTPEARESFFSRHPLPAFTPRYAEAASGGRVRGWVGIDAGSTTSKLVLLDDEGRLVDKFYGNNEGEPLRVVRQGLLALRERCGAAGFELEILGAGSTGYGEAMLATAFEVDHRAVETVAHVRAAVEYVPDVSFVLDIGGQDMKAIWVHDKAPVTFQLNEACSAGCGSFLETYAKTLGIQIGDVAKLAFKADAPSKLGSRCTVFMNSSIITEQRNGRSVEDIVAGLCRSVVENALTKVLRLANYDALGAKVVAQGGTFRNDAVLRAFEQLTGRDVFRPPHPGEMGAIGIALLTRDAQHKAGLPPSKFLPWREVEGFQWRQVPASACDLCSNSCLRTVVEFPRATQPGKAPTLVTGNRCEKGEVLDRGAEAKARIREIHKRQKSVPDLVALREGRLSKETPVDAIEPAKNVRIGIPRTLEFWDSLPFWSAFFRSLGFGVTVSPQSSASLLELGLPLVPSDTVCLPAKLVHGHVQKLIQAGVNRIFHPFVLKLPRTNKSSLESWMCPVVQGYSEVVRHHDDPERQHGIAYDAPAFSWEDQKVRDRQIVRFAEERLGVKKKSAQKAILQGDRALAAMKAELDEASRKALDAIPAGGLGVVLAGRPYHADHFINHDLASHFTAFGIPVLDVASLPGVDDVDVSKLRIETNNEFHTRLLATAMLVAEDPRLQLVQIVSFGCGHDAVLSDEITRVMRQRSGKTPLVLKLDEGDNRGPVGIRVRSFVESLRAKRKS